MHRITRGIVATLALAAVAASGLPRAVADSLDDRRAELDRELAASAHSLDDASAQVNAAVSALATAREALAGAQSRLAAAERATKAARAVDEQRQAELAAAEHRVKQAEADVAAAQAAFDSVDARTNEEITVITQQSGPLVHLALLVTDVGMADLNQRAQLSETLFSASALELDELQERRFRLDAAKAAADEARSAAAEARRVAAEQLRRSEALEAEADRVRDEVAVLVKQRDESLAAAEDELERERQRQAELEAESASVDKRIADRIAAAEAKRKAEEAARAAQEAASKGPSGNGGGSSSQSSGSGGGRPNVSGAGFLLPVKGRFTSPFGMRLHPVLGYWKLHDGTDIAASCGTPIRAAADGEVAERYYNAGYGNRLMIDHGRIDGKYVTTGYNHAQKYVVSVGQRVSRGQVIGYVGSTGYSTGCHLHLMVWENNRVVNAMTKWFR